MKLQEFLNDLCYHLYVSQKKCFCGKLLNLIVNELIANKKRVLEHYSHPQGWSVEGFNEKQWLYIKCLKCHVSWPLNKLGVPKSTTRPLGNRQISLRSKLR